MLEYIYEWIGNIAFYMIMVIAVLHLLPNSDYQKYIRFFTGLVLVILLATPILKIFGMEKDLANLYDSRAYQEQMKKIEESSEFLNNIAPIEETAGEPLCIRKAKAFRRQCREKTVKIWDQELIVGCSGMIMKQRMR